MVYTKADIIEELESHINEIPPFIANVPTAIINKRHEGKWSIAENAEHLIKSVQPINLSLSLPKISFFPFGKVKTKRNYEEVVQLYHDSLNNGGKAGLPYTPKPTFNKRSPLKVAQAWKETYSTTIKRIDNWSEGDLDKYCLPHPLIGKLTMREMLFFTVYHIEHHFNTMKEISENA